MVKSIRNTFTSGEIAKLANISKQTLSYYEKEKLLKPAKRNQDNNYAYYSLAEHHMLEMIVCMRRLGFSIKSIREFLHYRDENIVSNLLRKKQEELILEQKELMEKLQSVQTILRKTDHIRNLILDRVLLEQLPEYEMYVSQNLSSMDGDKNNLIIRLNFMKNLFRLNNCDLTTGWFLSQDNTKKFQCSPVSRFFAMDNYNCIDDFRKLVNHKTKNQCYVSIYGKGNYHHCCEAWIKKCFQFIERNELEINGDTIVSFEKDYWITNDKNEYVFKLSIPVK